MGRGVRFCAGIFPLLDKLFSICEKTFPKQAHNFVFEKEITKT